MLFVDKDKNDTSASWAHGRGPHLQLRQEPQGSSDFRLRSQGPCRLGTGESGLDMVALQHQRSTVAHTEEETPGAKSTCILLKDKKCHLQGFCFSGSITEMI